jgi:predicted  nucleic acid-binding Zn-ribbon protein
LNEEQTREYSKAKQLSESLKNEQRDLERELTALDKKGAKAHRDNQELRSKIMKLDQLIYGKTKSPFKRLYS